MYDYTLNEISRSSTHVNSRSALQTTFPSWYFYPRWSEQKSYPLTNGALLASYPYYNYLDFFDELNMRAFNSLTETPLEMW